jgi:hypothetical protein
MNINMNIEDVAMDVDMDGNVDTGHENRNEL